MGRSFKLNNAECSSIINKRAAGASVEALMADYGVSQSTVYRVLSGEYSTRMGLMKPAVKKRLFQVRRPHLNRTLAEILGSPELDLDVSMDTLDPMTKAAADLVIARAKFNRVLHSEA